MASILSAVTGRYKGSSNGKGGRMLLYMCENNYYGNNGIVGEKRPLGASVAFAP